MKFYACLLSCVTEIREMKSLKSNPDFVTLNDFSVEQKNSSMYLLHRNELRFLSTSRSSQKRKVRRQ